MFFTELTILSSVILLRPEIANVNSDEPVFYPFSIKTNKCSDSFNDINDQYAKMCFLDAIVLALHICYCFLLEK